MKYLSLSTAAVFALFSLGIAGAAYAVVQNMSADDCARLIDQPERWQTLREAWQTSEVIALVRHASDCDPDTETGCINGNEHLTEFGKAQAKLIGNGIETRLGGAYNVQHSYLERTRTTAILAFGDSKEDPAITKPCKATMQDHLENHTSGGNEIFVTHSSCINSLKNAENERVLGFNAAKDPHFGIAAFLKKINGGRDELIGCVWPEHWAHLPPAADQAVATR